MEEEGAVLEIFWKIKVRAKRNYSFQCTYITFGDWHVVAISKVPVLGLKASILPVMMMASESLVLHPSTLAFIWGLEALMWAGLPKTRLPAQDACARMWQRCACDYQLCHEGGSTSRAELLPIKLLVMKYRAFIYKENHNHFSWI